MAAVSGQGTTFNLPNYHGELYAVTPTETPFLSAIGGLLNGAAEVTHAIDFEWQTIDRRSSSANNAALEGANAPTAAERSRSQIKNCVEIHHSSIEVSYSKLAATSNYSGVNVGSQPDDQTLNEVALQAMAELEAMAVDIEQSFLTGTYARPANNSTVRTTQGIFGAAATVSANGGTGRALTKALVDNHLKAMFDAGAKLNQQTTVLMVGAAQKINLSNVYGTATLNAVQRDRTIGGVAIDTLVTDFGTFGVMTDRWTPTGKIGVVDLGVCRPVWLEIPEKGLLFTEELPKAGASRKFQLYGEVGLKYGPTNAHGVLADLN